LTHVISQLQKGGNPFDEVLGEIEKMIQVIEDEGKADKEKLDWCKSERKTNKADRKQKISDIDGLDKKAAGLEEDIEDPVTGLKKQIDETQTSLLQNGDAQKTQTEERSEENTAYQADVKNLKSAANIIKQATTVLENYYNKMDKAFLQSQGDTDPEPPKTWDGKYEGQSDKGGDVIGMLQFILKETVKEEDEAHSEEEKAQGEYEDSMTSLKKEQTKLDERLAGLQETLAEKEQDLLDTNKDLKSTTADKEAIEAYLDKIAPGCDFITDNFEQREKNRATETSALNKATRLIKGTPAYKTAVNDATVESYGDCKEPCIDNPKGAKCLACRADVTVPAYCAGHKGTPGC